MTIAIRLENLSKNYGRGKKRIQAVKDANLEVEAGQVYGFLGPNGAGKTTAIRMMLDLIKPSHGTAYLYDQNVREHHDVLRRVGIMVEGAAFYPYLNGFKNLEVLARTHGCYDKQRIQNLLKQVGLADRPKLRYKGYSLGMKQRLGLAAALLHDPELLILDEPTNGLDPAGIQEMRSFIRELVDKQGKTVFLSSHMLNEVEQVCDRVAIIRKGEIIREGRVAQLLDAGSKFKLRVSPGQKAAERLGQRWTVNMNGTGDTFMIDATQDEIPLIARNLVEAGINIYEITPVKQSLEEFFLTVTQTSTQEIENTFSNPHLNTVL